MLNKLFDSHSQELGPKEQGYVRLSWILLGIALVLPSIIRLIYFGQWWAPDFTVFFRAVGMDPMNASGFASIFVLFLMARPTRSVFNGVMLLAVFFELYYLIWFLPPTMSWEVKFLSSGGGAAMAGLLGLIFVSGYGPSQPSKIRARMYFRLAFMLALYPFTSAATLGALSQATPMVYDSHVYLIEGSLGFQPAGAVAQFLQNNPYISPLFETVYSRLPIWIAIGVFLNLWYEEKTYFDLLGTYLLAGFLVIGFYYLLPMVGIDYYLGSKYWPMGPFPETVPTGPLEAPTNLPRSCMPSMHAGWILMSFFCMRRISRNWSLFYGALVPLTLIAALSAKIGHYVMDFIPSVPFVLGCIAITTRDVPDNRDWRLVSLLYGFGVPTLIAAVIRGYGPDIAGQPWLVWPSLLGAVIGALFLEHKLAASTLGSVEP